MAAMAYFYQVTSLSGQYIFEFFCADKHIDRRTHAGKTIAACWHGWESGQSIREQNKPPYRVHYDQFSGTWNNSQGQISRSNVPTYVQLIASSKKIYYRVKLHQILTSSFRRQFLYPKVGHENSFRGQKSSVKVKYHQNLTIFKDSITILLNYVDFCSVKFQLGYFADRHTLWNANKKQRAAALIAVSLTRR